MNKMRYWYKDIRWGVMSITLGTLVLMGGGLFLFFTHNASSNAEVTRVGVETYIGEGRKDEVINVQKEVSAIGLGSIHSSDTLGVVEVPRSNLGDNEDETNFEEIDPRQVNPEFTGVNRLLDEYHLYHSKDVLNVSFGSLDDFYILGTKVSDGNDGSFKFEESLLAQMRTFATENGILLSTYGTLTGPGGQVGAYIITDESPLSVSHDGNETPSHYALSFYMWDDENVMYVSGLITSKTLPEWLSSLHLS